MIESSMMPVLNQELLTRSKSGQDVPSSSDRHSAFADTPAPASRERRDVVAMNSIRRSAQPMPGKTSERPSSARGGSTSGSAEGVHASGRRRSGADKCSYSPHRESLPASGEFDASIGSVSRSHDTAHSSHHGSAVRSVPSSDSVEGHDSKWAFNRSVCDFVDHSVRFSHA